MPVVNLSSRGVWPILETGNNNAQQGRFTSSAVGSHNPFFPTPSHEGAWLEKPGRSNWLGQVVETPSPNDREDRHFSIVYLPNHYQVFQDIEWLEGKQGRKVEENYVGKTKYRQQ